jgi:hypothetical protein
LCGPNYFIFRFQLIVFLFLGVVVVLRFVEGNALRYNRDTLADDQAAPARCAWYSAMSCVGTCSGVPRKQVSGDIRTRFGKWISPIWIGSDREVIN